MTTITKLLEIVVKDRSQFVMGFFSCAALLRLVQAAFPQRQTLTHEMTTQPLLVRRTYVRKPAWSRVLQLICEVFSRGIATSLGIHLQGPQIYQKEFQGSDKEYNRNLCQPLIREIEEHKHHHWLAHYSCDLGKDLKFFYDESSFISFQEKQKNLICVLQLNDMRREKGYLRILSHREFLGIVKLVIGDSLKHVSASQLKNVEKVWSFFSFVVQQEKFVTIEKVVQYYPALLKLFVQTVTAPTHVESLNSPKVIEALDIVIQRLDENIEFHLSLFNAEVGIFEGGSIPPTVADMQTRLSECVDQCNAQSQKVKIQKALGENSITLQVELLHEHYQAHWSIYPVNCYLDGIISLENFFRKNGVVIPEQMPGIGRAVLKQFVVTFRRWQSSSEFNDALSKACFKTYILCQMENKTERSQMVGDEFVKGLFHFVAPLLNNGVDKTEALLVLNNMRLFLGCCVDLDRQRYPIGLLIMNIQLYFSNHPRHFYQKDRLDKFVGLLDCQMTDFATDQSRWKQIIEPIQKSPFQGISVVVVPFIRQLIPKGRWECVDKFQWSLPSLKRFLTNNEAYLDLRETLSDPCIVAIVGNVQLGQLLWSSTGEIKTCLTGLLLRLSKGEVVWRNRGIMEKPLTLLIENIKGAQKLREELILNKVKTEGREARIYLKGKDSGDKIQEWFVVELPELAAKLDKAPTILYLMSSFMRLTLGSLPIGTSLTANLFGALSGLLKVKVVSNWVVNAIRKDDPDAALADLLENFTDEERQLIIPILQEYVIPLVAELVPVLQEKHDIGFYTTFFKYLDDLIKSKQQIDQKELEKKLAEALLHLITEIEQYKPTVQATLQHVWETIVPAIDSTSSSRYSTTATAPEGRLPRTDGLN